MPTNEYNPQEITQLNQTIVIRRPPEREMILVDVDDWDRFKDRAAQCDGSSDSLNTAAWSAVGIGISFLLFAIALPYTATLSNPTDKSTEWPAVLIEFGSIALTIASFAFSVFGFIVVRQRKKNQVGSARSLAADMRTVKGKRPRIIRQNKDAAIENAAVVKTFSDTAYCRA